MTWREVEGKMATDKNNEHWLVYKGHPVPETILHWAERPAADYPEELRRHLACCQHCSRQLELARSRDFATRPVVDDTIDQSMLTQQLDELIAQRAAARCGNSAVARKPDGLAPAASAVSGLAKLWCSLVLSLGRATTMITGRGYSFASNGIGRRPTAPVEREVRSLFELEIRSEQGEILFPQLPAESDEELQDFLELVNGFAQFYSAGLAWKADGGCVDIPIKRHGPNMFRSLEAEDVVHLMLCIGGSEIDVVRAADVLSRKSMAPSDKDHILLPPGVVLFSCEVLAR
jgi:hypothetical protein